MDNHVPTEKPLAPCPKCKSPALYHHGAIAHTGEWISCSGPCMVRIHKLPDAPDDLHQAWNAYARGMEKTTTAAAPVESVPAPAGLDLEAIECALSMAKAMAYTDEQKGTVAQAESVLASLSPRPTPMTSDKAEMDKLCAFLLMNFTGEWGRNESAADVAIRYLSPRPATGARPIAWTKEKPTREGWYWYHQDGVKSPGISEVFDFMGRFCMYAGDGSVIDLINGKWAGPIPDPEAEAPATGADQGGATLHPSDHALVPDAEDTSMCGNCGWFEPEEET